MSWGSPTASQTRRKQPEMDEAMLFVWSQTTRFMDLRVLRTNAPALHAADLPATTTQTAKVITDTCIAGVFLQVGNMRHRADCSHSACSIGKPGDRKSSGLGYSNVLQWRHWSTTALFGWGYVLIMYVIVCMCGYKDIVHDQKDCCGCMSWLSERKKERCVDSTVESNYRICRCIELTEFKTILLLLNSGPEWSGCNYILPRAPWRPLLCPLFSSDSDTDPPTEGCRTLKTMDGPTQVSFGNNPSSLHASILSNTRVTAVSVF